MFKINKIQYCPLFALVLAGAAVAQKTIVTNIKIADSTNYYGKQIALSFDVDAAYAGTSVQLELLKEGKETACPLLRYPFQVDTTSGQNNDYSIDVPTCTSEGTEYKIRVIASGSSARYDSPKFAIKASDENCARGSYGPDTGTEPGCVMCDIGTYQPQSKSTECKKCPNGMTTSFRGAGRKQDCNETIVAATEGFVKFDKMYFYHSNAAGHFSIASDHQTQDECAAKCKQDPGCKAFDAGGVTGTMHAGGPPLTPLNGNHEIFQKGDCFLSYDRFDTIKQGDVGIVNQLELFVKLEAQLVKDIFFRKTPMCYIKESNDGGAFRDEHSPEACAQLCLDDMSCVSYDAGIVATDPAGETRWQTAIDDCFLSYKTRSDVGDDFICDTDGSLDAGDPGLDYFEKIVPKFLEIKTNFDAIGSWDGEFENVPPSNAVWKSFDYQETGFFNYTFGDAANRCWCNGKARNGKGDKCQAWGDYGGDGSWCHVNENCPLKKQVPGTTDAWYVNPCFNRQRGQKKCPNVFSYQDEVLDNFPFLVSRETFSANVQQAIADKIGEQDTASRVEASSDAKGVTSGNTVATVNTNSNGGDSKFNSNFPEGKTKTLNVGGTNVDVTARAAVRCSLGYASQSGYAPGCQICPPDTYANRPQTACLDCPLGTVSDAGSATTGDKACRPQQNTVATRFGPFRQGYEWVGVYSTPLGQDGLKSDGSPRRGKGAMTLKITSAEVDDNGDVNIDTAISVLHGENCPENSNCRNPGITEYFMKGKVTDGTDLYIEWENRYHGITDRNMKLFSPGDIFGTVSVKDRNSILKGTMETQDNGQGNLVLYERCHAADESGTFQPGNRFVGTFSCYRRGTDMAGQTSGNDPCESSREGNLPEKDVREMRFDVTGYEEDTGVIYGDLTVDTDEGNAQYEVSGKFNTESGSIQFDAGAGAWNTGHPSDVPARQLSGRLSDDGERFIAQYNANPSCKCNGTKVNNQGGSCKDWDLLDSEYEPWCFVSEDCPDRRLMKGKPNTYLANCNVDPEAFSSETNKFQTCDDVTLYRICSLGAPNCPSGWSKDVVQDRCLRSSTSFPDGQGGEGVGQKSFSDAQDFCAAQNGSLVSIHSAQENAFVASLARSQKWWLGLNRSSDKVNAWSDGSRYTFSPLLDRNAGGGCGAYNTNNKRWSIEDCSSSLDFLCKKLPLGRTEDDCACNGQSDDDGFGGRCNFWDGQKRAAWCYVNDDCIQGVKYGGSILRKAPCFDGPGATTTPSPTPFRSTVKPLSCNAGQYQIDGACRSCTSWQSCASNEFLDGECSGYSTPTCKTCPGHYFKKSPTECVPCDVRCGTCNGTNAGDCLTCDQKGPNYLEKLDSTSSTGACLSDCHVGGRFWKDNATKTCKVCTDPGQASDSTTCSEFADTKCNGISSCPDGFEKTADSCCVGCVQNVSFSRGGRKCQPIVTCPQGSEQRVAPTTKDDRICRNCLPGTVSLDLGQCRPYSPCGVGQEEGDRSIKNSYTDTDCVDCQPGYFSDGDGKCVEAKTCVAGDGIKSDPTTTTDRVCERCSNQFTDGDNQLCRDQQVCSVGLEEDSAMTRSSDRTCKSCVAGETFSDGDESTCKEVKLCGNGKGTIGSKGLPTASSDRGCFICPTGQFSNADVNSVCTPFSECLPGQEVAQVGRTFRDTTCADCGEGVFSADGVKCRSTNPCIPGYYQGDPPTSKTDYLCFPCLVGSYSNADTFAKSALQCQPYKACGSGTQIDSKAPKASLTTDVTCAACVVGTTYSDDNNNCKAVTACTTSQVVGTAATVTSDATCVAGSGNDGTLGSTDNAAGGSSMVLTAVVIIVIVVVLAIVIGAVVYIRMAVLPNARASNTDLRQVAFGNPMYDTSQNDNYGNKDGSDAATGYMDVPDAGIYSDPVMANDASGYMDVSPQQQDGSDDDGDDDDDI